MSYPIEIQNLIEEFSQFPGIGPKTAQRFVFYLLRKNTKELENFITNIKNLKSVVCCCVCGNFSSLLAGETDKKICFICQDKNRNRSLIIIVAQPQDLMVIEKIGEYKGLYHILGGLIDTSHGIGPQQLRFKQLLQRLKDNKVKEVILALNATIEGESTALYISNLIKKNPDLSKRIKLSKLARGIPLGGEIEYADEITLSDSFKNRKII